MLNRDVIESPTEEERWVDLRWQELLDSVDKRQEDIFVRQEQLRKSIDDDLDKVVRKVSWNLWKATLDLCQFYPGNFFGRPAGSAGPATWPASPVRPATLP